MPTIPEPPASVLPPARVHLLVPDFGPEPEMPSRNPLRLADMHGYVDPRIRDGKVSRGYSTACRCNQVGSHNFHAVPPTNITLVNCEDCIASREFLEAYANRWQIGIETARKVLMDAGVSVYRGDSDES